MAFQENDLVVKTNNGFVEIIIYGNGSTNDRSIANPPIGSVWAQKQNVTNPQLIQFYLVDKTMIAGANFAAIKDLNGDPFGADIDSALSAILTLIAPTSGGGGGGGDATAANQQLQIDEAVFQTNLLAQLPDIAQNTQVTSTNLDLVVNQQTNGAQVSKDFLLAAARGQIANENVLLRVDKNTDIDTTGLPEGITFLGGAYTGFPVTGFGAIQVLSSSAADIGILTVTYLASQSSTDYQQATFAVNGTTPTNVDTGGATITAYRVISAIYQSTANRATTFNLGTITVRYIATPAVAFLAIPIGANISHGNVYTVPQGKKALLLRSRYSANNVAAAVLECAMFIRPFNFSTLTYSSPLACFSATVTAGTPLEYDYGGGFLLNAGTDIVPIVRLSSTNNVTIEADYSLLVFNA